MDVPVPRPGPSGLRVLVGLPRATLARYRLADPAARTEATRKILQWRELPEGYYPAGAISMPMLMEMAILSDHEPEPGQEGHGRAFGDRGLIFMSFNSWIGDEQELLKGMRGELKEPPKWIRRSDARSSMD